MRAMVLERVGAPLVPRELAVPVPGSGEIQLAVEACGVCRTDLHVVDGELPDPRLPLVPGHQIVGTVSALGAGVTGFALGDRVGVPWLGWTCGRCVYCAGIHMSDIPAFPYRLLWEERTVRSVANLTRRDGDELLALAPAAGLRPTARPYPLADANQALDDLRAGRFEGAMVLMVGAAR